MSVARQATDTGPSGGTAARFVDAVGALERDGDPTPLVDLYAERSQAGNVQRPDAYEGRDGARQFWLGYRSMFGEVSSRFRTVVASDDAAALEWTTAGTVHGGPVRYDGVTMLELVQGEIVRSCAYYDPSRLGRVTLRATGGAADADADRDAADQDGADRDAADRDAAASASGGADDTAVEPTGASTDDDDRSVPADDLGPGGVDARPVTGQDGWRPDPGETG